MRPIDRIDPADATFDALIAHSHDAMFVWTLVGEVQWISYVNAAMVALLGYDSAEELLGRDARDAFLDADGLRRCDGAVVRADLASRPVEMSGVASQLVVVRPLKLEVVGQLAGGVAHDFNNFLAVILSNVTFALEDLDPAHPVVAELREVEVAAQRATLLTKQLLTLSSKRTRAPRVSLDTVIASLEQMLATAVTEASLDLPRRCRARTASAAYRARFEPELTAATAPLRIAR